MSEPDPSLLGSDQLLLRGRMQITTALAALSMTGVNPDAEKQLTTFLDVHGSLSDGQQQDDLMIYLQGGDIERTKTDIIISLELMEQNQTCLPDTRVAARGLLDNLGIK